MFTTSIFMVTIRVMTTDNIAEGIKHMGGLQWTIYYKKFKCLA